jgi:hypothetical protein
MAQVVRMLMEGNVLELFAKRFYLEPSYLVWAKILISWLKKKRPCIAKSLKAPLLTDVGWNLII